jgi:hypothetical protein
MTPAGPPPTMQQVVSSVCVATMETSSMIDKLDLMPF